MPANSGNGGKLTIGVIDLHVTVWDLDHKVREVDNTNSGSGGFSNYEAVVKDIEWTAEGFLDEDNLPDVDAGAAVGSKASITFKEGADSRTMVLTNTLVTSLKITCNNSNDIVRFRAAGKGCTAFTNHAT